MSSSLDCACDYPTAPEKTQRSSHDEVQRGENVSGEEKLPFVAGDSNTEGGVECDENCSPTLHPHRPGGRVVSTGDDDTTAVRNRCVAFAVFSRIGRGKAQLVDATLHFGVVRDGGSDDRANHRRRRLSGDHHGFEGLACGL